MQVLRVAVGVVQGYGGVDASAIGAGIFGIGDAVGCEVEVLLVGGRTVRGRDEIAALPHDRLLVAFRIEVRTMHVAGVGVYVVAVHHHAESGCGVHHLIGAVSRFACLAEGCGGILHVGTVRKVGIAEVIGPLRHHIRLTVGGGFDIAAREMRIATVLWATAVMGDFQTLELGLFAALHAGYGISLAFRQGGII